MAHRSCFGLLKQLLSSRPKLRKDRCCVQEGPWWRRDRWRDGSFRTDEEGLAQLAAADDVRHNQPGCSHILATEMNKRRATVRQPSPIASASAAAPLAGRDCGIGVEKWK